MRTNWRQSETRYRVPQRFTIYCQKYRWFSIGHKAGCSKYINPDDKYNENMYFNITYDASKHEGQEKLFCEEYCCFKQENLFRYINMLRM